MFCRLYFTFLQAATSKNLQRMFYAKAARDCALRMLGDGRYIVVYRMTAF